MRAGRLAGRPCALRGCQAGAPPRTALAGGHRRAATCHEAGVSKQLTRFRALLGAADAAPGAGPHPPPRDTSCSRIFGWLRLLETAECCT
jgi:hypothetical protein